MKKLLLILFLVFITNNCFAALQASTVWEFRTAGSNDNGGGYTSGGTDYSQQDASQLSLTDGATSGIGVTTLTSATGGFTAAMIGNIIYLRSGTNVTVGWYEITAHTDTNTVTLDRAPDDGVGGISSGTLEVGGARALPTDAFFEAHIAGNKTWMKAGTYTLTEQINVGKDGTQISPIVIEGYNATRDDDPTGTDRPLIATAGNDWIFDDYWEQHNLRGTTTDTWGFRMDRGSYISNCQVTNTSGSADSTAFGLITSGMVFNCEGNNTNGRAFNMYTGGRVVGCYARDSNEGVQTVGSGVSVFYTIFNTCVVSIDLVSNDFSLIMNNTFFGDKDNQASTMIAISGTDPAYNRFFNNIFDNLDKGVNFTTDSDTNIFDYNNWSNNTTDVTNATKGGNATALDPGFDDAINGDFDVGTNMKSTAAPYPNADTGLTSSQNELDQGSQQRVEAGGLTFNNATLNSLTIS